MSVLPQSPENRAFSLSPVSPLPDFFLLLFSGSKTSLIILVPFLYIFCIILLLLCGCPVDILLCSAHCAQSKLTNRSILPIFVPFPPNYHHYLLLQLPPTTDTFTYLSYYLLLNCYLSLKSFTPPFQLGWIPGHEPHHLRIPIRSCCLQTKPGPEHYGLDGHLRYYRAHRSQRPDEFQKVGFSIDIRFLILLHSGWIVCLSLVWFAGLRGGKERERERESRDWFQGGSGNVKDFKTKKEKPIAC